MLSALSLPSEDSAQLEKSPLMPRGSNRHTYLNRSKYRIDHEGGNHIARSL
jgi:hypothetical protein